MHERINSHDHFRTLAANFCVLKASLTVLILHRVVPLCWVRRAMITVSAALLPMVSAPPAVSTRDISDPHTAMSVI